MVVSFRFLENEYPESLIIDLLKDATKAAFGNEKVCLLNFFNLLMLNLLCGNIRGVCE